MSTTLSTSTFQELIERSGLLTAELIDPYFDADNFNGNLSDTTSIAKKLIAERLLTPFQVRQILLSRFKGFFLTEKYKVLDFLGAGGVGKVCLCEHLLLHRLVAVKLLHFAQGESGVGVAGIVERFYREARAVATLDHPNIVRVFDVDRMGTIPFMVMEYVDGKSLHQIVSKQGPLSSERTAHYIAQIAAGLEHAHKIGLVHRDIKPGNILLERTGTVKILDLGMVKFSRDLTKNHSLTARYDQNAVLGTVDYMAPEQANGDADLDIRADIYSLGCTMYSMLTGRAPFPKGSLPMKLVWHQTRAPESVRKLRPEVPVGLSEILDRMMAKKPSDRFQTPAAVAEALAPWTRTPIAPPAPKEMPAYSASVFRLGLATRPPQILGAGLESTPRPRTRENTMRQPRSIAMDLPSQTHRPSDPASIRSLVAPEEPVPDPVPSPPKFKRSRWTIFGIASAAALAIAVAGLVVWLIWGGKSERDIVAQRPLPVSPRPVPSEINPKEIPKENVKVAPFVGVILNGGGSTFVNAIMQRWAEVYEKRRGIRVDYQGVGSGKGTQGVIDRVYLFGCSDVALSDKEMAKAAKNGGEVVHIPLVMGAVVPTYNLPEIARRLRFTGPILADIYLGKITHWNDPAIQINNPGVELPPMPIAPVHREDSSGTTFIWTDYLSKASAEWREKYGAKKQVEWPSGVSGSGNNGVASLVSRNIGSIGYVELTYALENNLRFGEVKNREGKFVFASLESVTAAGSASLKNIPDDLRYTLTDAPGSDSYPITGTSWAILYVNQTGSTVGKEVVEYLRWTTHEGQAYLKDLKFAPLPPDLVKKIDDKLAKVRVWQK